MKTNIPQCNFILLLSLFFSIIFVQIVHAEQATVKSVEVNAPLKYSIYKFLFKVGEMDLMYKGEVDLNGQDVLHIIFDAKGMNFSDHEDIYLDVETFFPLQVNRKVDAFGKQEKIVEYYIPNEGKVEIVKTIKDKTEKKVIEKNGPLENIYGFIYNFRIKNTLKVGDEIFIRLPTKDITMTYMDQRKFSWRGEKRQVAYLESNPKQFRIWFDIERGMIPLRIDGAVGFGKTSMILKDTFQ